MTAHCVAAARILALACGLVPVVARCEGAAQGTPALDATTVQKHAAVSRRAAAEGMVLLKNDGALPLATGSKIALFGAVKDYLPGGGGSANVKPVRIVNVPDGLAEAGFSIDQESRETAVMVLVRNSKEGRDCNPDAFNLSRDELKTLSDIKAAGFKRIVVVCNCGHAMNLKPLADDPAVGAILWTWFPGGEGGTAVGDILSGAVNPSGRLASTFAEKVSDWPSDQGFMESRGYVAYEDDIFVGYRYFETIPGAKEKVVYPFGYGLDYTAWQCEKPEISVEGEGGAAKVTVKVRVTNTGDRAGRRSVLCYTSLAGGKAEHPALELRAFAKTRLLAPGESEDLALAFPQGDLAYFDDEGTSGRPGSWVLDCGEYSVWVGGSVRDIAKAGAFTVAEPLVLSTPGFKLQTSRLARRLRADGSQTTVPLAYPVAPGFENGAKFRAKPVEKPAVTLFDVADGKATLDDLLGQMTRGEIIHLLYGHPKHDPSGTGSIGDLAKFGISAAQTCDGPAGVRRAAPSTYFPCAALLAGTFDAPLLREIGGVIGEEAAEVDFDILLAPGLCIHRHPLCGRNFEYFSEDPLVAGVAAAEYVKGVQAQGVGATLKHFAGNNREAMRFYETDIVSERAMREIYLRGFERAVKDAQPWAIMTAYNAVNGYNSGASYGLVTGILRDEWGFKGLAMTDWCTSAEMWREIVAGNDVKMPDDSTRTIKRGRGVEGVAMASDKNFISNDALRQCARRVLELVMKTRRFAREKDERK